MRISRACELCGGRASLHCASDSAFLCFSCDADVHEANFLVARHVRRTLCRSCDAFDGSSVSGVGFPPVQPLCSDCDTEDDDGDRCSAESSSSSACVSNSSAAAANRIRKIGSGRIVSSRFDSGSQIPMGVTASRTAPSRAEGILAFWSRRMGLRNRRSVALALRAYGICLRKFTGLPLHVSLAASLWLAAGRCEPRCGSTCRLLRLIQCSRVPPKLILFVGRRLSRRVVRTTRAKESSRKRRICRVLR